MDHSTIIILCGIALLLWLSSRYFIGAGHTPLGTNASRSYWTPRPAYDGFWGIVVCVLILWAFGII